MKVKNFVKTQLVVVGKRKSGKTNFVKWLCCVFPNHLIFDFNAEYNPKHYKRYKVKNTFGGIKLDEEFNRFVLFGKSLKGKIDLIVIEEANLLVGNRIQVPFGVNTLIDLSRHDEVAVIWVARRMSQLNTNIVELADWLCLFKQTGINDLKRLKDIQEGYDEIMRNEISMEGHNFILSDLENHSIEKVELIEK